MNIVADLLSLIAENLVFPPFDGAFDEIAQKTMQFDARVIGAGQAAATQATGRHAEIAAIFLHHHIRRHLRGTEQRMFALVDRQGLGDAVRVSRIGEIPARFKLHQRQGVRTIAVNLIG